MQVHLAVRLMIGWIVANRPAGAAHASANTAVRQPRADELRVLVVLGRPQGSHGGHQLERRARWVQSVARPIEKLLLRDRVNRAASRGLLRHGPRIARSCEQPTAGGVEDNGGARL